jgi:hypothetical protein
MIAKNSISIQNQPAESVYFTFCENFARGLVLHMAWFCESLTRGLVLLHVAWFRESLTRGLIYHVAWFYEGM